MVLGDAAIEKLAVTKAHEEVMLGVKSTIYRQLVLFRTVDSIFQSQIPLGLRVIAGKKVYFVFSSHGYTSLGCA